MFSFIYHFVEDLPKLAWLAEIKRGSTVIDVWHGSSVECQEAFFVSGVWDGPFSEGNFDKSTVFWGTGASLDCDEVRFVTPSHAIERLVTIEEADRILVSNSFPFILAFSGYDLDSKESQYEAILCSIVFGLNKMEKNIPLASGHIVNQYIASILSIDKELKLQEWRRPAIEDFTSFDDYYTRLLNALTSIRENSIASERQKTKYDLISTISSGYDSSTCSAMAKKIGCDTVVTLKNGKYDKDSGRVIAQQLGYKKIIERDCSAYKNRTDCIEAEYISSGEVGTQLQFCVFEDVFADKLAFFGVRGCYWEKDDETTDDFEMANHFYFEADISWTENALKNGYIVAPMVTYGSANFSSINKITNSKEMEPWSIGGTYDKPIPRRILEENGVSRNAFGQNKYGGGFSFWHETKSSLKKKMTSKGYDSYLEFTKNSGRERKSFKRLQYRLKFYAEAAPIYFNAAVNRIGLNPIFRQKVMKIANPGAPSDLIFWSVRIVKSKYEMALEKAQRAY